MTPSPPLAALLEDSELREHADRLRRLYAELRDRMWERWQRDVPFEELLFDRWEHARQLGFGDGASLYHNSYVFGTVNVGANTWIGPFTLLDGSGGLEIGRSCSISAGVQIYTHDTLRWALSDGRQGYERAPVRIGDCCYIGSQTVISKGVDIGHHSVIGACSLVNRSVPAHSVAFGRPCRVVGRTVIGTDGVRVVYGPAGREHEFEATETVDAPSTVDAERQNG